MKHNDKMRDDFYKKLLVPIISLDDINLNGRTEEKEGTRRCTARVAANSMQGNSEKHNVPICKRIARVNFIQ